MGMNPFSGDIERFGPERPVPKGWLELTRAEVAQFLTLPLDLRLQHYIRNHRNETCATCGMFTGNHSLRAFKHCAASKLGTFDLQRLEELDRQLALRELVNS